MSQIVSWDVCAVLGEFLAEAKIRRAVQTATKPSTTVFASKSSEEMPATPAGSRTVASILLLTRHMRNQLVEYLVRINAVRLGMKFNRTRCRSTGTAIEVMSS